MIEKKDKIVSLESKLKSNNIGDLLPVIYSQFSKDMKPLIVSFFEQLDDSLFDHAEKASSNNKQSLYFESMRMIRKSRKPIFLEFFKGIRNTFQLYKKGEYDYFSSEAKFDKQTKSLKLSLVDEKELDESLAKTNLINKSEMAFHENIFALLKRFSVLASGTKLKSNHNPIGPYVIVNSFANSIRNLELDIHINLIVYKLFERNVMSQLNRVYNNINDFLARQGIIPEIQYNIGNNHSSTSQSSHFNTQTSAPPVEELDTQHASENNQQSFESDSATSQNISDENYQLISNLFKQNENNTPNQNTNNGVPIANIDLNSMLNALSILQTDLINKTKIENSDNKSPTQIKQELLDQLHALDENSKEKVVRKKDEDTIDLVGMLFQFIVDDRDLPAEIQVILARLQIPYLKIALEDKNLFADKTHPARVLLDKLSRASVGWTPENDVKNKFSDKLTEITYRIFDAETYGKDFFDSIINDFDKFIAKQKKRSEVLQKRTQEKSLGQDKIQQAKEYTAKLLVSKMTQKHMPKLVRDILLGEWSSVLVLIFLRYGVDSKEFKEKVDFVDKVIQFSDPVKSITIEDLQQMSENFKTGLKLVAFNAKELMDKQHQLVECINEIHDLESESSIEIIPPEEVLKLSEIRNKKHDIVDFIEEIIEPVVDEEEAETVEDDYLQIIKDLKVGTWLEFNQQDSDTIRAKLSWISPITGKYLFVNSRGLKITDKTINSLAKGLREKNIRILQQVALFDRALSSIATKMQNKDEQKD